MVFDKTKAMRNAERYLAQGKIQSAIGEYKQVVANDPKDFGTLNMLGDLHTKNADKNQAVKCYTSVAEHYSKQGFAQKAIAVYNKITKLQPGSIEISEKLAELYKFKGSVSEARSHYKTVAEHYEREGKKIEALEIRKQMASLDPNDTAIHLTLAAAYLEEDQPELAAESFIEAGNRLAKKAQHAEAVEAYEQALKFTQSDPKLLQAYTQSHFELGTAADAAARLEEILSDDPHNSDILGILIDCHLKAGNASAAEKAIVSLVEKEPANYPKLGDLARIYIQNQDADSAGRVMAMLSEHLLLAGESDQFEALLTELMQLDPEQLEGLRLRARLAAWQRDESGMHSALAQLAAVARQRESIDDERYALSQLVMIAPHEIEYGERLKEISEQFGFDAEYLEGNLFDEQFMKAPKQAETETESAPELETFAPEPDEDFAQESIETDDLQYADFAIVGDSTPSMESIEAMPATVGDPADEKLAREVDSIKFYIDSGYLELAEKAIGEMRAEYGSRPEIEDLMSHLKTQQASETETSVEADPIVEASPMTDAPFEVTVEAPATNGNHLSASSGFGIDDLRSELGIDEPDASSDSDYDTHYHTAVAYQEMGLLDEAIREYQEAVGLVKPNDPARRFFQCANLLGHCFMQKSMPNLALTWYQRALESPGLGDEEKQGIWYELALAYEADGDLENAGRYFEQVYAEDINFRDVSERMKNIVVGQ